MYYLGDFNSNQSDYANFGVINTARRWGGKLKRGVAGWVRGGEMMGSKEFADMVNNINDAAAHTSTASQSINDAVNGGLEAQLKKTVKGLPWGKIALGGLGVTGGVVGLNYMSRRRREDKIKQLRELRDLQEQTGYK